jgi:hypothetical protein
MPAFGRESLPLEKGLHGVVDRDLWPVARHRRRSENGVDNDDGSVGADLSAKRLGRLERNVLHLKHRPVRDDVSGNSSDPARTGAFRRNLSSDILNAVPALVQEDVFSVAAGLGALDYGTAGLLSRTSLVIGDMAAGQ